MTIHVDDILLQFGGAVKALDDSGRVGGWLVEFSDPATRTGTPDIDRQFFTIRTDFDFDPNNAVKSSTVYYDHGLNATIKKRKIGRGKMEIKDAGVWMEAELELRDDFEKNIFAMVKAGKLGWSSGSLPHLVDVKSVGDFEEIINWPLGGDASLTPIPSFFPSQAVVALKSYIKEREDNDPNVPWSTAYKAALPNTAFAYVETTGEHTVRHFPLRGADGKLSEAQVKSALADIEAATLSEEGKEIATLAIKNAAKVLGLIDDDGNKPRTLEEVQAAVKSLFSETLKKMSTPSIWKVCDAFMSTIYQIQELMRISTQSGVEVDIKALVDEALSDFEPAARLAIESSLAPYSATKAAGEEPQSLGAYLTGTISRLIPPRVKAIAEAATGAFKGLFDEVLKENEPQVWNLWDAVRQGCKKIAEAASSDVSIVLGTKVDVKAKVKELLSDFVNAASPMIVAQIEAYVKDPEGNSDYDGEFWLKSQHSFSDLILAAKSAEFDVHSEAVVTAVGEHAKTTIAMADSVKAWVGRGDDRLLFRFVKDGRTISAVNRDRMGTCRTDIASAIESLQTVDGELETLMKMSEPKVKAEIAETELLRFQQFEYERNLLEAEEELTHA